nr:hypothetical protein [uncultured Fretibacterium sp.]
MADWFHQRFSDDKAPLDLSETERMKEEQIFHGSGSKADKL